MDGFSYLMRDARGQSSTGSVIVRVKPFNYAPVANDLDVALKKNTSLAIYFAATDAEKDQLTFRVITAPQHGELWSYPTLATYYPRKGYFGDDSFTYVANDGKQDSLAATVRITIFNSNNPPAAISQNLLTKTNRSVFITPAGTDPDDDPLTFEIVTPPDKGTLLETNGGFRFTPPHDYVGDASFTFRPYDGTAYGTEGKITIGIIATNARPRANPSTVQVQPNIVSPIRISGTDPDGDKIVYTVVLAPLHGELSGTPPDLKYSPATNYLGPDRFTFKVADGFDESDPVSVTIQVSRQNRAPKSEDQSVQATAEIPLLIPLSGSDPDGDSIESVILKGPASGLVYGRGTNLTYVPGPGASGFDSFTYKLWDGQKFGNVARVNIQIAPRLEDQAPSFTSIKKGETGVELTISVPNLKPFFIQSSTNLLDWTNRSERISTRLPAFRWEDNGPTAKSRYYRIQREP
jgi:hypothetical protein